jgi:purine-nucleoside phosphorylase
MTVEMEAATFFAVANFRGVKLAQILYAADDVSGTKWKSRKWRERMDVRHEMFEIAVEYCMQD